MRRTDQLGTEWTLSLLPLGGYVGFPGENDAGKGAGYTARSPLARMAIIAAGPLTNLMLALVVFGAMLAIQGQRALLPVATVIVKGSAADLVGFRPGDRIVAADSASIATLDELRPILQASAGQVVEFRVLRSGKLLNLSPRLGTTTQEGRAVGLLGIQSKEFTHVRLGLLAAAGAAAAKTWGAVADTIHGVTQTVTTGRGTQNFVGVLGITQLAGQAALAGDTSIFTLIAILSANLALMNLLPVPILDGGAFLCNRPVSTAMEVFPGRIHNPPQAASR